jgi:hypothetical protein
MTSVTLEGAGAIAGFRQALGGPGYRFGRQTGLEPVALEYRPPLNRDDEDRCNNNRHRPLQYEAELHSRVVSERGLPEQSASNDLQNAGGFRAINQTRGTNIERAGDDAAEENWDNEITYDVSLGLAVGTVAGSSRAESVTGRRGTDLFILLSPVFAARQQILLRIHRCSIRGW